jgi:hypothetical protein
MVYRVYVIQIARENFTSVHTRMSREESSNTTVANHVGQRDAGLGQLFGKATGYRFQKRENWKNV